MEEKEVELHILAGASCPETPFRAWKVARANSKIKQQTTTAGHHMRTAGDARLSCEEAERRFKEGMLERF